MAAGSNRFPLTPYRGTDRTLAVMEISPPEPGVLTVGKLCAAVGVGVETVRFYERRGLLPVPSRSASGYRLYGPDTVARLSFIQRAKRMGFTLAEIIELLALQDAPRPYCAEVQAKARQRMEEIGRRLADLRAMHDALGALVAQCGEEVSDACPLIEALSAAGDERDGHDGHVG